MVVDDDTGDFNIKYVGNAKKYETYIKQGVNRWSSIGTGGVYIEFRTSDANGGNTVASTYNSTVTIYENKYKDMSSNLKILTIAHEVGHVLGIGLWGNHKVNTDQNGQLYLSDKTYPKTVQAYIDNARPTGITLPGPPIESDITLGSGSYKVHWDNDPIYGMHRDLMIYQLRTTSTIISIIDLTYLQEIGRTVDLSQAQSLKATFRSVIGEYVFKDEISPYSCSTCSNH